VQPDTRRYPDDVGLGIDLLMDCDDTGPIQTRGTLTALLIPRSR
jgi:hypothetical protein